MDQRSGIQKRALKALRCIINGDLEDAFFNLSTAIDATSKRHYPGAGSQKQRYCDYLHTLQKDMFLIATSGVVVHLDGFCHPETKAMTRIADEIYKVRCQSIHDPEEQLMSVSFVKNGGFGFDKEGRFMINAGMLIALTLLVLTDPANRVSLDKHELNRFGGIQHGTVRIDLSACIGGRARLMAVYKRLKKPKDTL